MTKEPIYITENSVDAFMSRLSALTATEPKRTAKYARATCILRYEANKRSREARIEGDFTKEERFEMWFASRPSRSMNHYATVCGKIDL